MRAHLLPLSSAVLSVCGSPLELEPRSLLCTSQSQANPIASIYPKSATGTINGTLAVLPIPLEQAQQIVGSKYPILTAAYRELLPGFPAGMYPAILQAVHDHDVQSGGIRIPDFSRVSIEYPFVDLLDDGYSSFRYAPVQALTATNALALAGSAAYGTQVYPSTFEPPCDAYAASSSSSSTTSLDAYVGAAEILGKPAAVSSVFGAEQGGCWDSHSLASFFVNVTNQPSYADPSKTCDNMIRLFNTSLTAPPHAPVVVRGHVAAQDPFFPGGKEWDDVWGVRIDTAFIENNYLDCATLKGYSGTGPGD